MIAVVLDRISVIPRSLLQFLFHLFTLCNQPGWERCSPAFELLYQVGQGMDSTASLKFITFLLPSCGSVFCCSVQSPAMDPNSLVQDWSKLSLALEENEVAVATDRSAVERTGLMLGCCLLGKLQSHRFLAAEVMRKTFASTWRVAQGLRVELLGKNPFIFRFDNEDDRRRVLKQDPWFFLINFFWFWSFQLEGKSLQIMSFCWSLSGSTFTTFLWIGTIKKWLNGWGTLLESLKMWIVVMASIIWVQVWGFEFEWISLDHFVEVWKSLRKRRLVRAGFPFNTKNYRISVFSAESLVINTRTVDNSILQIDHIAWCWIMVNDFVLILKE